MQRTLAVRAFLFVWLAFTACLLIAVLRTDQLALHRTMHPFHSVGMDAFFARFTHLADGWVPTALALALLVIKDVRSFLMMGLSCGLSAIVTQILKHWLDRDRPSMFSEELGDLHWVPGIELHHHLSFPSGHTTAAFSMCLALAVLIGGRVWGALLAVLAVLLAYSRVYLSQHFTEDILAGAAIGTLTAWGIHEWLYRSTFSQRPWLDRGLFRQRNQ